MGLSGSFRLLHDTTYGFCRRNIPYGVGRYVLYGYLGMFGQLIIQAVHSLTKGYGASKEALTTHWTSIGLQIIP